MRKVEEELKDLNKAYENINLPDKGREVIIKAMEKAKTDKRKAKIQKEWRRVVILVAAAFTILFILTNTNEKIAYAMEQIPLVGKIFEVITIREYTYNDGHNSADVKVPKVLTEKDETIEHPAVNEVNKSVEEYTNELLAQFENNMLVEGYQNLDVSYEVATNNDTWFALDVAAVKTQASGYEFHRFYNINKVTGEQMELNDLFIEGSNYIAVISEEIKNQMKKRMAEDEGVVYWLDSEEYPEDNFKEIKENQNFYLDNEGNLVIVFDEYEVAPGYMGVQKFTINKDILKDIINI
jgi:Protein of unknown function (DUF3298)